MSPHISLFKRQTEDFGFKCPLGGTWYACDGGSRFVGCCDSNPCSTGCSQGNVRGGGFNSAEYGKFADATCGTGSDFYSCSAGNTFWGCCKSNPCAQTPPACPSGDLTGAWIDGPAQIAAYINSTALSTSSSSSAASTPTSTPSTSATPPASNNESHTNIGAIAGGAAGGGAALAIIIGLIFYLLMRKKKNQRESVARGASGSGASGVEGKNDLVHSPLSEAPPVYSSPHSAQKPWAVYGHQETANHSQDNYHYELPAAPGSPNTPSELAVEQHQRMELESPMVSPGMPKIPESMLRDTGDWTAPNSPQHNERLGFSDNDGIAPGTDHENYRGAGRGYHGA